MKLFNLFKKKKKSKNQNNIVKSSGFNSSSFGQYLLGKRHFTLASRVAIDYYSSVSPVAVAVNKITNELQGLIPRLFDTKTNQFVTDNSGIIELINNPNPILTKASLLKFLGAYQLMTGNSGIVATGNANFNPVELYLAHPSIINPNTSMSNGFVASYSISTKTCGPITDIYFYDELNKGSRIRYLNKMKDKELYHLKSFSPNLNYCEWGSSPIEPAWMDIEQYFESQNHNWSMLLNGVRPSGVINFTPTTTSSETTETEVELLRQELVNYYQGTFNSGRPMVLTNSEWQQVSANNVDMDFLNLKKDVEKNIYNILGVPLPLVVNDSMTLANMETSTILLYNQAVIPLAHFIFSELTRFLAPRFKLPENFIVTIDKQDIEALAPVRIAMMSELQKTNTHTDNELRTLVGREGYEGGDVIYKPATLVPIGKDTFIEDEL